MTYLRLFLLFLCSVPVSALAATQLELDIYKLPEGLAEVRTFGKWHESGIDGMYRVLIVRNEGLRSHHSMFVQWICDCKTGRLASLPVTEINSNQWRLSDLEVREKDGLFFLQLKAMEARTREEQVIQVQFNAIGDYRFASKKSYSKPDYYSKKDRFSEQ